MKLLEMDHSFMQPRGQRGLLRRREKAQRDFPDGRAEPELAILDETDSGLDIDALKIVANGVNSSQRPGPRDPVVTHYQRLLNYIVPDFVHVMVDGRIVKSGGKELALELEEQGYDWVEHKIAQPNRLRQQNLSP